MKRPARFPGNTFTVILGPFNVEGASTRSAHPTEEVALDYARRHNRYMGVSARVIAPNGKALLYLPVNVTRRTRANLLWNLPQEGATHSSSVAWQNLVDDVDGKE